MLLGLYHLFAKSPDKSSELIDIVEDPQETFWGGGPPVRPQDSHRIGHKTVLA